MRLRNPNLPKFHNYLELQWEVEKRNHIVSVTHLVSLILNFRNNIQFALSSEMKHTRVAVMHTIGGKLLIISLPILSGK